MFGDNEIKSKRSINSLNHGIFDVGIIGGGFGGLSAALLLGRYLRSVVIFDNIKKRDHNIRGYLGFENTPIKEAIQKSWREVLHNPSVFRIKKEIRMVTKGYDNLFYIFTLSTSDNSKKGKDSQIEVKTDFKARYLIIATGVDQIKPTVRNFDKFVGNGIWHCPHCNGFATTDKKLIIITSHNDHKNAIKYAKVFLGWPLILLSFYREQK